MHKIVKELSHLLDSYDIPTNEERDEIMYCAGRLDSAKDNKQMFIAVEQCLAKRYERKTYDVREIARAHQRLRR